MIGHLARILATVLALSAGLVPSAGACEPGAPPGKHRAPNACPSSPSYGKEDRSGFSHLISTENSAYNPECNPWLTADEEELFYISIGLNGPMPPGYQGDWDIFVSRWDSVLSEWGPGTNLGPSINTPGCERRPSTTATGDTLFFTRNNAVWVSFRSGGQFGPPVSLFEGYDPAISADASRMYYVRNADLWVADRGTSIYDWVDHRPVGPPVNTIESEVLPFLSADGTKLFFSDHGGPRPGGFGGGDLWVSTWTGSGWGVPANVGPPINTDRETCTPFLTRDGQKLYTASESFEGSRGDEDIWVSYLGFTPPPKLVNPPAGTWTKLGELDGAWNVYDLASGPDGTLYAATMPDARVFRSTDCGQTWSPTAPLPGASIAYSLLIARGGALFVGTYPNGDVFRSTDRGNSWQPTAELPASTAVRALLETADDRILAGTSPICRIYATTDAGESWTPLGPTTTQPYGISTLFESGSGSLFAGGWGHPNRSDDGGLTWTAQNVPPPYQNELLSIESFLETERGVLWCTGWVHGHGGYVFRSTDGGAAWDTTGRVNTGPIHVVRVYDIVESAAGDLLIGFQPGPLGVACRSSDAGQTWAIEGSLEGAHEILRFLKLESGAILAATTPNGDVFRWTPGTTGVGEGGALEEDPCALPGVAALLAVTPNPTASEVRIRYQIPHDGSIHLVIVDPAGRMVRVLRSGPAEAGRHEVVWDCRSEQGSRVASGVYFIRLRAEQSVSFQKLAVIG